jgi:hypothetical protein
MNMHIDERTDDSTVFKQNKKKRGWMNIHPVNTKSTDSRRSPQTQTYMQTAEPGESARLSLSADPIDPSLSCIC